MIISYANQTWQSKNRTLLHTRRSILSRVYGQKIVSPYIKLEITLGLMFLILRQHLGGLTCRKVIKRDFSKKFSFYRKQGKRAKVGPKSELFGLFSNLTTRIVLIFYIQLESYYSLIFLNTTCPAKIRIRNYGPKRGQIVKIWLRLFSFLFFLVSSISLLKLMSFLGYFRFYFIQFLLFLVLKLRKSVRDVTVLNFS